MKRYSYTSLFLTFLFTVVLVFIVSASAYSLFLNLFSSYCVRPVLRATHYVKELKQAYVRQHYSLDEMNALTQQYKKQYEELFAEYCALAATNDYSADIQEILAFKKKYAPAGHIAHIIGTTMHETEHSIMVDQGSVHGITENMVAVYNNCLVGKVIQVFPRMAKIVLITDRSCKCAAYTHTTHAKGIFEGMQQKDIARLVFVNHLDQIKKGDLVITQGEGPDVPRGFALGIVTVWAQEGFQYQIQLKPLIDVSELSYVLLIKKGDEQSLSDFNPGEGK